MKKKIALTALLIAFTQSSAAMPNINIDFIKNNQATVLTTLGVAGVCVRNCNKPVSDLPAALVQYFALEALFNKLTNTDGTLGIVFGAMAPSNKTLQAIVKDLIRSVLKNCAVNPGVNSANEMIKKIASINAIVAVADTTPATTPVANDVDTPSNVDESSTTITEVATTDDVETGLNPA